VDALRLHRLDVIKIRSNLQLATLFSSEIHWLDRQEEAVFYYKLAAHNKKKINGTGGMDVLPWLPLSSYSPLFCCHSVSTWDHTHVIFPGPGWRDITVTSWPLSLSRRVSSRPTNPDPPPARTTIKRKMPKQSEQINKRLKPWPWETTTFNIYFKKYFNFPEGTSKRD